MAHASSRLNRGLDVKFVIMHIIKIILYYIKSIVSILQNFENPVQLIQIFLSLSRIPKDGITISLKTSGLIFHVRNKMDIWSIKETFIDDFYHFNMTEKPANGVILDIGAGIGEFAIQAGAACPDCTVFGFEPFTESAKFFSHNISANSLSNVNLIQAAVTSKEERLTMDVSSGNPLQYRTLTDNTAGSNIESLQIIQFLQNKQIEKVEFLKMDCEGGEFNILLPLEIKDIQRFKSISMEYHDSITNHDHKELVNLLIIAGFSVECVPNIVHGDIGYIYAQRP